MNMLERIKRLALGFALVGGSLLGGCGDNIITWREEVRLLDGRVITVTQKRRVEQGRMSVEAWLAFNLPEFSADEIVWHENLETQVLNVYRGKLYVVGLPFTEREYLQYGKPYPEYVAYRYDAGSWTRIPFTEIPEAIYDTNMYFDNMALYKLKHVSLEDKAKMQGDAGYMPGLKRLSPTFKTPH
jgi:hypothetical protein